MQVEVHGRNVTVSERLREFAVKKVAHATRFFDGDGVVDVELSEERNPRNTAGKYHVEITVPVAGRLVRVEAAAHDEEAAVDVAVDKFEQRLRRLKKRLITRSRTDAHKRLNEPVQATDEDVKSESPRIERVKQFALKPMTAEEAALQMELLGHDFFLFVNAETDLASVLYRRKNGSYGLIEPA